LQTFPGAYLLYHHNNKKHAATVSCDICGKSGMRKEKLKGHKINKHMQDHEKVIDESKICLWVLVLILFGFVNHIWKI
jgi:uncharacterized membrane protein YvbJ